MKFLKFWVPVFLWMGMIFYLSSRESVKVSDQQMLNLLFFKFLHIIEYFILYLLIFRALVNDYLTLASKTLFFSAAVISMAYSISDEIHQLYVPTREGKIRDVIIDAIGVSLAWAFLLYGVRKIPPKLQIWVKSLGYRT